MNGGLAAFVDRELGCSKLANMPHHDLDEIKESLISRSNGMYVPSLMSTGLRPRGQCTSLMSMHFEITSSRYLRARMTISLLSDSYQNARAFQQARKALLQDPPRILEEVYNLKMFVIQANNSPADALAVGTYLRILAGSSGMEPFAELHQAATHEHPALPCYTPDELAERAQGLLEWDPESRSLRFIHFIAKRYVLSHTLLWTVRFAPGL